MSCKSFVDTFVSRLLLTLILITLVASCGGMGESELIDGDAIVGGGDSGDSGGDQSNPPVSEAPGPAAVLYTQQCFVCHGETGRGGSGGDLHNCDSCDDRTALYSAILDTMPIGDPSQCDVDCSESLTNYILSGFQDESGEAPTESDDQRPIADLSASQNIMGTIPLTVNFNAVASSDPAGQIVQYLWDFGDTTTSSGLQATHTYETSGNYVATLTVFNADGLSDSSSIVIQAQAPFEDQAPQANFSSSATSGVAPLTIEFDASNSTDDVGIIAYRWDFNGVSSANGQVVSHTFTDVGQSIQVTLTVTDTNNQISTATQALRIAAPVGNEAPIANASLSANLQGDAPLTVQFNGFASSDDGENLNYIWSFGDGTVIEGAQHSYQYTGVGEYTAILTVSDGELTASDSVLVRVTQPENNAAPVAQAEITTRYGVAPLTVSFDATDSSDDNAVSAYSWLFGDGDTSANAQTSHLYDEPGTYEGSLMVSDEQGLTDTENFTIVVQDETEIAAGIYMSQCASCHGDEGDGVGLNPGLRVGRDLASQTEIVRQMPPGSGINCGGIDDCAVMVARYTLAEFARENQAPVADAGDSSNTRGNVPLNVFFNGAASSDDNGVAAYNWDFGDDSTGTGETVSHIYTAPGTYLATLTVTDEEGASSTDTVQIVVVQGEGNQPPIASIEWLSATTGIAPFSAYVTAEDSADDVGIASVAWDFTNDGVIDSTTEISAFQYETAGNFELSLQVTDAAGLNDDEIVNVIVYDNDAFGEDRYSSQCAFCHGDRGQGGVGPRLTASWTAEELAPEVLRMLVEQTSDCFGVDQSACASSITDYLMANIVGTGGDGDSPFACEVPEPAGGIDVKRLSRVEYRNTMFDIVSTRLGENIAEEIVDSTETGVEILVPNDHHESGFREMDTKVALEYVEGWFQFSLELADAVLPYITIFVGDECASNTSDTECMRRFITNAGREFFRKPLNDTQVDTYATSSDYRELLVRMFNAPDFVYHMEIDGEDVPDRDDLRELTPYELAARLSYTYWQSMPDADLRAATENGELVSNYEAVLDRVMSSPKARHGLDSYFEDWWETEEISVPSEMLTRGLRLVDQDPGDADTRLPLDFDTVEYREEAIQEVLDLAEYVTFEQQGSLEDLFTNTNSFARTPNLASAYGVNQWSGDYDALVTLPEGQRSGLLTRAAFHIYGGYRSNAILKGVRIRTRLLCDTIPVPANNVPPDVNPDPNWTTRELIAAQTESTDGCRDCHAEFINPPGFATEDFDVLGRFRQTEVVAAVGLFDEDLGEVEGNVFADIQREVMISASVQPHVDGEDDNRETSSGVEFSSVIASSPKTAQCMARTFFRHTFSREEEDIGDGCVLQGIEQAARDGSMQNALRTIAEMPEFKLRKISTEE